MTIEYSRALSDMTESIGRWRVWSSIIWHEIRLKYRRSTLGPFWITFSMLVTVGCLAYIFGTIMQSPLKDYLPFVVSGVVFWTLISGVLNEGCLSYINNHHLLKNQRMPLFLLPMNVVWKNLIILMHHAIILLPLVLYFIGFLHRSLVLFVPGAILLVINLLWMCFLLAILSARFRDIPELVRSFLQLAFFITPIMWYPILLGLDNPVVRWNPFTHMVAVVRDPLLGRMPEAFSWWYVVVLALLGWIITFFVFVRVRRRILFWI